MDYVLYFNALLLAILALDFTRSGLKSIKGERITQSSLMSSLFNAALSFVGSIYSFQTEGQGTDAPKLTVIVVTIIILACIAVWKVSQDSYTIEGVEGQYLTSEFGELLNQQRLNHSLEQKEGHYEISFEDQYISSVISLKQGAYRKNSYSLSVSNQGDLPEFKVIMEQLNERLVFEPVKYGFIKAMLELWAGGIVMAIAICMVVSPEQLFRFIGIN